MLDNKVLVILYVISLGEKFEVFIPVNEKVGNISRLLNGSLFESIDLEKNGIIINLDTGSSYNNNDLVRNTDIKNNSRLALY